MEAALKFARCATGRPRILYCDHAFHGLTAGSLSVNGAEVPEVSYSEVTITRWQPEERTY